MALTKTVAALASGGIVASALFVGINLHYNKDIPEEGDVVVEEYNFNGTFQCEYYKHATLAIHDIIYFETFPTERSWNWKLFVEDGAVLHYTQGIDKICYVMENVNETG